LVLGEKKGGNDMERKRDSDLLRKNLFEYLEDASVSSQEMEQRMNAMLRIQAGQYKNEEDSKKN